MDRGSSYIYNLVALVAFLLAIGVIVVVVAVAARPAPPVEEAALPTSVPSLTPLPTATEGLPTLPPTFTPTFTETWTPTTTATWTPSPQPSSTITPTPGPTDTPSLTFTPSISPTFTPTHTPTGPTLIPTNTTSPFPFNLRDAVAFQPNLGNAAGCNWQGVAGRVLDLNGTQFGRDLYQVRVFNTDIDRVVNVGSNSYYGELSGFEQVVDNQVNNRSYRVRLETLNGTVISPVVDITFPSSCEGNVAIVTFIQTRPL